MAAALVYTGDKAFDAKLANLGEKVPVKAIKAGINGGLTPVVKAIKRGVKARGSKEMQAAVIPTIDKVIYKIKKGDLKGQPLAIAGFAARSKGAKRKKAIAASLAKGRTGGGVGISAPNVHWAVLGTTERTHDSGKSVGSMPAIYKGVVQQAFDNSKKASLEGSRKAIERVIIRESKRKG